MIAASDGAHPRAGGAPGPLPRQAAAPGTWDLEFRRGTGEARDTETAPGPEVPGPAVSGRAAPRPAASGPAARHLAAPHPGAPHPGAPHPGAPHLAAPHPAASGPAGTAGSAAARGEGQGRGRRRLDAVRSLWRVGANQPLLPVVRRAFLAFLLVCLAIIVPQWLIAPVVPQRTSWLVLPALAGLVVSAFRLYRTERPNVLADLLNAVGVGVVIWSVGALPAGGVLFVGVAFRALYGRLPGTMLSVSLTLVATTAGVLASGGSPADVKLGQYGPGLVLSSLALRLVLAAVQRYETSAAARFEAVVRSSRDVIVITDADTVASYVSPALELVFGASSSAWAGDRLLSWIVEEDRDRAAARVQGLLDEPGAAVTFVCRVPADGVSRGVSGGTAGGLAGGVVAGDEPVHVEISAQNLLDDPHVHGLLFAVRDVTQRMRLTEELRHQAFHDPLTGLPNRALLGERLSEALCGPDGRLALLLVDLDSFKSVNDTLGHIAGDELLVEVAARLEHRLLPGDTLARLGGDEFAVVLVESRADPHVAEGIADVLLSALEPPILVGGELRRISASIGISVSTGRADADQLMREADIALYRAKGSGKARHVQYRHELHKHAVEQMQAQLDLREALVRDEFVLHYQPIHDLGGGGWTGVEALVRWNRRGRGQVGPARFVPLAESSGLIVPLGRWVLAEACRTVAGWQRLSGRPLQVNVNVSVRQLVLGDVVGDVRSALDCSGLAPESLTLEITESTFATDDGSIEAQLVTLRQQGIRIALDDFGTGFNSLGHLHQYPVDELKIDKSFVGRMGDAEADSLPIITAIMAMSRSLGLTTVAEGIETEAQHTRLIELACDFGQGFRLSPPLTASALELVLTPGPVS